MWIDWHWFSIHYEVSLWTETLALNKHLNRKRSKWTLFHPTFRGSCGGAYRWEWVNGNVPLPSYSLSQLFLLFRLLPFSIVKSNQWNRKIEYDNMIKIRVEVRRGFNIDHSVYVCIPAILWYFSFNWCVIPGRHGAEVHVVYHWACACPAGGGVLSCLVCSIYEAACVMGFMKKIGFYQMLPDVFYLFMISFFRTKLPPVCGRTTIYRQIYASQLGDKL